jgi:hypothetical protein
MVTAMPEVIAPLVFITEEMDIGTKMFARAAVPRSGEMDTTSRAGKPVIVDFAVMTELDTHAADSHALPNN